MGTNELLGYSKVPNMSLIKYTINRVKKVHGPHNIDIYSLIFGSLLGNSYAEKRNGSTRIILQKEESNVAYLFWFHNYLAQRGYCSHKKPKLEKRIGTRGRVRFLLQLRTYSFASFNWIYDAFYLDHKKVLPKRDCWILLTPLALAIWIMDNGALKQNAGFQIATNSFQKEEILFLCELLNKKYNLNAHPNRDEYPFAIYIPKTGMPQLGQHISKYLVPSMHRKLNGYYFV